MPTKTASPKATPHPSPTRTRVLVKSSATATPVPTRTIKAKPTGKPSPTPTGTATATGKSSHNGAKTVSLTTQTSLCVQIAQAAASSMRGHAAQWTVSAWTTGGNVPDATLSLQAAPASGGAPGFAFGCGSGDGSSSCDLGPVDAKSAPRQLQAQLTVPVTASSVKSVRLTAIGSAANLTKTPEASATVAITAPPASTTAPPASTTAPPAPTTPPPAPTTAPPAPTTAPPAPTTAPQNPTTQNAGTQNAGTQTAGTQNAGTQVPASVPPAPASVPPAPASVPPPPASVPPPPASVPPAPVAVTSPLPVGSLPSIPAVSPSLSQGGNAAPLFPKLDPTPTGGFAQSAGKARTRPVADTSALPEGAAVVNAQLAGLSALALAFVLAVIRLSIRRRPSPAKAATDGKAPEPRDKDGKGAGGLTC